ncbi:MAG TPA: AMP-binding protein [Ilumatobacteraceae bacterium]|nr:AMP-binding protein [Ilumatobacteraceae bacterium]
MEAHLATLYEAVADVVGARPALIHGSTVRSWSAFDDRAARFAAALRAAGLTTQSKTGLYLYNGPEYLEAQLGVLKGRGVPVNINYRYRDQELVYLLENSDAEALVFHSSLADRVGRVVGDLGALRLVVQVADDDSPLVPGAVAYEDLVAAHEPMPRIERSPDDIFLLYTGGTTGMPKGVMFRLGSWTSSFTVGALSQLGLDPLTPLDDIPALVGTIADADRVVTAPCAPLMHGTGLTLGALVPQTLGATVVTLTNRSFDAPELLAAVQRHGITNLAIVGDVFSKPIVRAIDEQAATGAPYDVTSLRRIYSSGAMWSAEVKQALLDRLPNVALNDIMNSSEGAMATQVTTHGTATTTAVFVLNPTTKVFTDDGREVAPGSDEVGMLAASGNVPIGYYKDAEKTARTFREIDGVTYSFPGDMAKVAADGSLILLGRGNQVINTGGEKVFPEEVEEAVKRVAGVVDCLVVGVDDERFGQAVTAVVAVEPGSAVTADGIVAAVKSELAGYKAPRHVVFVTDVPRAPNGKPDHKTAREHARAAVGG